MLALAENSVCTPLPLEKSRTEQDQEMILHFFENVPQRRAAAERLLAAVAKGALDAVNGMALPRVVVSSRDTDGRSATSPRETDRFVSILAQLAEGRKTQLEDLLWEGGAPTRLHRGKLGLLEGIAKALQTPGIERLVLIREFSRALLEVGPVRAAWKRSLRYRLDSLEQLLLEVELYARHEDAIKQGKLRDRQRH
jgi:hypothetical protein